MTYKSSDSVERKYYKYSDGGHSGAYILPNATTYLSNFSLLGGSNDIGVKASSYYSSYYPWHVFDNTTSAWITNTGYPVWIAWSFFTNDDTAVIRPSILSITNAGANFPREGTLDYSDNGEDWTTITSWTSDAGANTQWFITVPTSYDGYHKYHRLNITAGSHATVDDVAKIQVSFYLRSLVPGTSSDYDCFEDKEVHEVPHEHLREYYKESEYVTAGTYTYNITEAGQYLITLIGGGGGSAQTDGGTDSYTDTAWSIHYGHSGGNGGQFVGWANLGVGTLSIIVGAVGTNVAGKGAASGNGGDSYAIFTPVGGRAVEIARAGGGHSGYPDGRSFGAAVSGGAVTYDSSYIIKVMTAQTGAPGVLLWRKKI